MSLMLNSFPNEQLKVADDGQKAGNILHNAGQGSQKGTVPGQGQIVFHLVHILRSRPALNGIRAGRAEHQQLLPVVADDGQKAGNISRSDLVATGRLLALEYNGRATNAIHKQEEYKPRLDDIGYANLSAGHRKTFLSPQRDRCNGQSPGRHRPSFGYPQWD